MEPRPTDRTGDVEVVATPRTAAGATAVLPGEAVLSGQELLHAQDESAALLAKLSPEKRALLEQRRRQSRRAAALPARGAQDPTVLSFAQERMFLLEQLLPDQAVYNSPQAMRLTGELDVPALRKALEEIVARHEVLRTAVRITDAGPIAQVRTDAPLHFELAELAAGATDALAIRRRVEEDVRRPFDLSRGPLLRALLLRVSPVDHVLVLTMHHIASDARSKGVVRSELERLYAAFAAGQPSPLEPLTRQYGDYAHWQRTEQQAAELASQLTWWRSQLAGAPEVCTFPTERPRPAVASGQGAKVRTLVPADELARIVQVGREQGATLFMTLLASFAALLRRYSGAEDVVVGTPITGRHLPETQAMVGLFLDTLVLRVDTAGDPSFAELVRRARETATGAYAHQQVPFDRLVSELRPERDLSRNPLFQVMVTLRDEGGQALRLPGLEVAPVGFDGGSTKFDLTVICSETARGLEILWQYSTDLFDPDSVARWGDSLRTLMVAAADAPDTPLSRLALLSPAERAEVESFTQGPRRSWDAQTVPELISRQLAKAPGAVVATDTAGRALTYAELDERAEVLAGRLRAAGVTAGDRVGLCVGRSVGVLVSMLATWKVGAAYVPLDAGFPASRLSFMLQDAGVAAVIRQPGIADVLPNGHTFIEVDASGVSDLAPGRAATAVSAAPVEETDAAYVMYTSGSTGLPKGVVIEHAALLNVVLSMAEEPGFSSHDVFLAVTTFSFDISGLELFVPPVVGGRVIFVDEASVADPFRLAELIKREHVTVMQATPSTWRMLVQSDWAGSPKLRAWCGGEALGSDLAAALVGRVGELWNVYGPTETTIWSTAGRISTGDRVTLGRPIANTTCQVLDPSGQPVPVGVAGELLIGGSGLARGYLDRPELTADRFVPDPSDASVRLYRTGDLVRWLPDGALDYLGRADGQIKLRGHRIELGEIEAALAAAASVQSAAVAVRFDRAGEPLLVGYVVLAEPAGGDAALAAADADAAQVSGFLAEWQEVWQQTYDALDVPDGDVGLDTRGWISSFSGEPIAQPEMREWAVATTSRIRALAGRRYVEIGCGSGMLLLDLARDAESYVGSDFAEPVIARLQELVKAEALDSVELVQVAAHELDPAPYGPVDTVVLNSVAQYFPSADYLHAVLTRAAGWVESGGSLFLGDIRSLPLLDAFSLAVEANRSTGGARATDLSKRVADRTAAERELVLHPAFFSDLATELPNVTHVQVLPKRGLFHNEMTCYRYDVVLHVGPRELVSVSDWRSWDAVGELAGLETLLKATSGVLGVAGIPDARVAAVVAAGHALADLPPQAPTDEILDAVRRPAQLGLDPELVYALADRLGVSVELSVANGAPGRFDAVFRAGPGELVAFGSGDADPARVNAPLAAHARRDLEHRVSGELLRSLAARLPGYMIPGRIVVLDALPLTPNGKLDRPALPTPTVRASGAATPPRTETERQIATLYADLLDLPTVGVDDDFFELGGHSLLAMQLFAQIEQKIGVKLPFRLLFEETTVERLAKALDDERTRGAAWSAFVALRKQGSGNPLWLAPVQRGDVLPYRLLTQHLAPGHPVYGLECAGLDGRRSPDRSIEAIAAHCVRNVREVQPRGPYLLGGYCFAGVVAYEMASQLAAAGEESEVLLLDAVPPWERSRRKRWQAKFRKLRGVGMRERLAHITGYVINVVKHRRGDVIITAARLRERRGTLPEERGAALVFETNKYARRGYLAPAATFGLTIIRVNDGPEGVATRELTSGGRTVKVRTVGSPGINHDNVILEPYVRLLAAEVDRWVAAPERS